MDTSTIPSPTTPQSLQATQKGRRHPITPQKAPASVITGTTILAQVMGDMAGLSAGGLAMQGNAGCTNHARVVAASAWIIGAMGMGARAMHQQVLSRVTVLLWPLQLVPPG